MQKAVVATKEGVAIQKIVVFHFVAVTSCSSTRGSHVRGMDAQAALDFMDELDANGVEVDELRCSDSDIDVISSSEEEDLDLDILGSDDDSDGHTSCDDGAGHLAGHLGARGRGVRGRGRGGRGQGGRGRGALGRGGLGRGAGRGRGQGQGEGNPARGRGRGRGAQQLFHAVPSKSLLEAR